MKIYDEVTIDMNPESSTYGEHLSEESHDYSGPMALCGKRTHKYKISKYHRGNPGIQAFARKDQGYRHPRQTPYGFEDIGYGTPTAKNVALPVPSGGKIRGERVRPGDFGGQTKKRFPTRYPRAKKILRAASDYGRKFGEEGGWYPTYKDVAYGAPTRTLISPSDDPGVGAFMSLQDAMQQIGGKQQPDVDFAQAGPQAQAPESWLQAGGAAGPLMLKESLGELKDAQTAIDEAGVTYYDEMERLEDLSTEAKSERSKSKFGEAENRMGLLRGELPKAEQRQADIGATGMAYSAPAELRAQEAKEEDESGLRDVVMSERDIQDKYRQRREDIGVERDEAQDVWDEATRTYGESLRDMIGGAEGSIQDMQDWVDSFAGRHRQFGEDLESERSGNYKQGYKWKNVSDRARMVGRNWGGVSPQGGWWTESGPVVPEQQSADAMLASANAFNTYLSGLGGTDFDEWFGNPLAPGIGPEEESSPT